MPRRERRSAPPRSRQAGDDALTFQVKDCALAALATGERAQNLKELRDRLGTVDAACIYYHFWGTLLRPVFDDPRYNNDFAIWVFDALHNQPLAERLGVLDPVDFQDIEGLRQELLDIVDEELDRSEVLPWTSHNSQFRFMRSQIVVFDTGHALTDPSLLADAVSNMSAGSIFYHFVDARRRTPEAVDDFRAWLTGLPSDHGPAAKRLAKVDPFFRSLVELRAEIESALRETIGR